MITKASLNGSDHKSFNELYTALGGKQLASLYNWIVIFCLYGTLVGYQIIIASVIQCIMVNFDVANSERYRSYHVVLVSIVIIFPLCLLRNINNFRYIIILSVFAILYTTLIALIELPYFWKNGIASLDNLVLFRFDWSFFTSFGIIFFSFMCQPTFYLSTSKLLNRDEKQFNEVFFKYN